MILLVKRVECESVPLRPREFFASFAVLCELGARFSNFVEEGWDREVGE